MKKYITTFAMLLLFTFGCTNQTSVTAPETNVQLDKKIKINSTTKQNYSVSKRINGARGGYLSIGNQTSALSGQGVYAFLYFPAGSFSGTKRMTMTINPEDLSGTFGPSMEFSSPVLFSALFTGLSLNGGNGSSYVFIYEAPNGQQTVIPNSFLYINSNKGVLGILNAQIPHFSRYAFVR